MAIPDRTATLEKARELLLTAMPQLWAIYLYGSFARNDERPGSDIDLAVLLPHGMEIRDRLALTGELSIQLGRDVDLVDLGKVGDVLRYEILADGVRLFTSRPEAVLLWEGSALTRYAHHREEIRNILADFKKTGIGYSA